MRRVLLLATTTGYQTRAFGDAAERLGVELVFATDRCHVLEDPWRDGAIPIRFYDEDESVANILADARVRPIDGVIAVGDRPTVIAARVCQALGLAGHAPNAVAIARDKQRTRDTFRAANLPGPWFRTIDVDADPHRLVESLSFPCIVKPVSLSGSRGVMRADDPSEFCRAFERLRALLRLPDIQAERNDAHRRILVEEYIPGREFALEGLFYQGTLHVLALFDKPNPLDGPFFEETMYVTPSAMPADSQAGIVDAVIRSAAALGLRHGPIHAECRVNDRGVFVLEVAARPIGGLCARALRFERVGVISFEELLLRHALGESPGGWSRERPASGVLMIPIPTRGVYRGVTGIDDASVVRGVDEVIVTARPDQLLVPLPEGASYLGFVFAHGLTAQAVERSLREAHARLRFTVDHEIRVV
jgi:biotin carboxylase